MTEEKGELRDMLKKFYVYKMAIIDYATPECENLTYCTTVKAYDIFQARFLTCHDEANIGHVLVFIESKELAYVPNED